MNLDAIRSFLHEAEAGSFSLAATIRGASKRSRMIVDGQQRPQTRLIGDMPIATN
jgi:hypothetical protein